MGVESFEVDQVNLRMVARTLPGKQFEVARELRARIAAPSRSTTSSTRAATTNGPTPTPTTGGAPGTSAPPQTTVEP